MTDIVFSDSAAGSLKMAQHYGEGEYCGEMKFRTVRGPDGKGPSRAGLPKTRRELEEKKCAGWEKAVPLGGSPEDVFGFGLSLSVGCVRGAGSGNGRLAVLEKLFDVTYPGDKGKKAAREVWKTAFRNLNAVRDRAESGGAMRLWYSEDPDEMCGLFWFLNLLKSWSLPSVKAVLIKLPEWRTEDGMLIRQDGWREAGPETWGRCLSLQKTAEPVFVQTASFRWSELEEENAPLRAIVNGRLQSVPENFYDFFLLRELSRESSEFEEAELLGRCLGKYHLGAGCGWLALRVEEMIRSGKLAAVTSAPVDSPKFYRKLRKLPA